MSHSHIRIAKPIPQRRRWIEVLFIACACLLVLVALSWILIGAPFDTKHETAIGKITESHVAIMGSRDSRFGGYILYQIQVHVRYSYSGQTQDRWIVGSELSSSREILQALLNAHPNSCEVYWMPNHPENAKCRFE
jgi:hypothetical protein